MFNKEDLYHTIDKSFSNICVDSRLKKKTIQYCHTKKQYNLKSLKVASILLIVGLVCNTNTIASIYRLFTYNTTANTFFPAINNSYILEKKLIQETEDGYVEISSCTIQDGFIYLEIESNLGTWEEWEECAKLKTSNDIYKPFAAVSGENFKDGSVRWDVIIKGPTDIKDGKFQLELPFISIPVECAPVTLYSDLEEFNQDNTSKDIKIIATKQADNNGTVISLNIFDKNNNLLETSITNDKIIAYDKQGNMYQYTKYDQSKNQFYFDSTVDNIEMIKILGFEQQIVPKQFNRDRLEKACTNWNQNIEDYLKLGLNHPALQPYFENQLITKSIDVPQKGDTLSVNEKFKIDDYIIDIIEIRKNKDSTLSIYTNKEQKNSSKKISAISYEINGINGYTYSNDIITTNEAVVENKIELSIEQLWILHENEWCIKFN